ncbi:MULTISPECIES: HlyU family transcriptional regulator [unclassified Halomonas]|uniref:HlyU family transcriptional regulator n=1 Tax=unclassified Halomonas TaxID=2609666 RepID=UPI002469556F|nr:MULTISPECIES: HlyU family transcriptional regulator [unclassified Halomonas]
MFKKLLSGLFGGGEGKSGNAAAAEPVEYKGYLIISEPADQGGQYRVSGWIRKPLPAADGEDGEMLEHRFDRSDMLPGREACDALMISKAQRFIDEVGDEMFSPR